MTIDDTGLSGGTVLFALDAWDGSELDRATVGPGGAATFDALPDGEHAINLQEADEASFGVSVDSTNSPVVEGDTLTVDATVENTGDLEATQSVTLTVGGQQRDATSLTLAAGESQSITLEWATSDGDDGNYTATVASNDDSAAAAVTVQAPAEFELDVAVPGEPMLRSETMTVEATATNVGDVAGSETMVVSVDGAAVETTDLTLQGGASETVTVEWDTGGVTLPVETDDWNRGRGDGSSGGSDDDDGRDSDRSAAVDSTPAGLS